jgi:hypothetical protein
MIAKFLIFGLMGICIQLFFSAMFRSLEKRKVELTGEASIILLPAYGLIGFIYPIIAIHIGGLVWYARGIIYTFVFLLFQYLFGTLLNKVHLCPWKYSSKYSFGGVVRLLDVPMWFVIGLAVEWIYPYVKATANLISP